MLYAEYFGERVRHIGVPKLSVDQFRRMMNIIHVEGIILGMRDSGDPRRYYTQRYRQTKSLNELTQRLPPEELFAQMLHLSEAYYKQS